MNKFYGIFFRSPLFEISNCGIERSLNRSFVRQFSTVRCCSENYFIYFNMQFFIIIFIDIFIIDKINVSFIIYMDMDV